MQNIGVVLANPVEGEQIPLQYTVQWEKSSWEREDFFIRKTSRCGFEYL